MNAPLLRFLERGFSEDHEALVSYLLPNFTLRKNAAKIFSALSTSSASTINALEKIIIEKYQGADQTTLAISDLLNSIHHPALYAAIVHGSIATDEIISYSDFDGLLIIDTTKINSPESLISLRKLIVRSELLLRNRDALQHHGWMLLLKDDLLNYPDDTLPLVMIKYGKVIFPSNDLSLGLSIDQNKMNYSKSFLRLSSSIEKKITEKLFLQNYYSFKNLLSEVLLLPTVYLQALNKKPIFKRDSFVEIKTCFTEEQLICISDASALRTSWNQSNVKIRDEQDAHRYKYPKFLQQQFRTPLPEHLKNYFSPERCMQIENLIQLMHQQLSK